MPEQATAAAAVAKTLANGGSITTAIWTLVAIVVATAGGIATAIVKQWGPWRRIASDDRERDFQRLREEIADLTRRLGDMDKKVEASEGKSRDAEKAAAAASEQAARYSLKLQAALMACTILLSVVERENADAPEIQTVRDLLAQAAVDDMGVGDALKKLAMVKGAGE